MSAMITRVLAMFLLALIGGPMNQAEAQQLQTAAFHAEPQTGLFKVRDVAVQVDATTITIRGTVASVEEGKQVEQMFRAFWPDGEVNNLLAIRHRNER